MSSGGVFGAIEKLPNEQDFERDSSPSFDIANRNRNVKAEPSDAENMAKLQHASHDPMLMDLSDIEDGDDVYPDIFIESEISGASGFDPNFHSAFQFDSASVTPLEPGNSAGGKSRVHNGSSRKGRVYKQWTDDQMERAITLVQQKNMSYVCAAQQCQVPVTSLRERLKKAYQRGVGVPYGNRSPQKKRPANSSDLQPKIALHSVAAEDAASFPQLQTASTSTRLNEAANFVIDQRASLYNAAQNYGVAVAQLKEHLKGVIRAQSRLPLSASCLTADQERTLVKWIRARHQRNAEASLTLATFQELVQSAVVINNNLNPNWLRVLAEELVDEAYLESFLNRYQLTSYLGEEKKPNDIVLAVVSSSTADSSTTPLDNCKTPGTSRMATSTTDVVGSPTKSKPHSSVTSPSIGSSTDFGKLSILVLQTGGTIDKDYPKTIRGYAFEIGPPAAQKVFQRFCDIDFQYVTVCRKDSQEISNADIAHLCTVCRESPIQRILITHGTDTLLDTAQILASAGYKKFIVLTGAFKPHTFKESDAEFNLGIAIGAVQMMKEFGVYVAFHGRVFPWDEVYRNPETGRFLPKAVKKSEMFHS